VSNKEKTLEDLEDDLIVRLQTIEPAQTGKLLRCITAEVALLITYDLEDCEEAFLEAVKYQIRIDFSSEKIINLRSSLREKVKKSIASEPHSYWINRLIFSLLLEGTFEISDQFEIIFNAADFCDLPLGQLEQIVMRDVE